MKNPKITVLMSVYNGEEYLEDAIDSILSQTFKDFEFLIINDGSIDKTAEILKSYNDLRIKIINNKENIGLTKSLNKGLKIAQGEYIARQDADDISMTERLEKEVEFLDNHQDYAVVGTCLQVIEDSDNSTGYIEKPEKDSDIRDFLKKDNCIGHGSAMIRKASFENVGLYYDEFMEKSQDYELWLRISKKYKIHNIPEYLYSWRNHKENISMKCKNEQKHFVEAAKVRSNWNNEMKKTDSKKYKFSILMANYNNGQYIGEAIQSVLNQTFKEWELVIIDDCSTDNSVEIIKTYLNDKRIRFIRNKNNRGYTNTLKRLIYESKSEIVGILDSDDVLTRDAIEVIYDSHIKNPDCGFIYSQFMYCDGKLNPEKKGYCKSIPPGKSNLHCNCVSAFRTFKKKDYFKTEGFDEEILYAEDKDIIFKMEEVTKLLFVDKILYKARFLPNSQGHHPVKKQISFVSFSLARYKAFKRRVNTNIPNLKAQEISKELYYAAALCTKLKDLKKLSYFLSRAIKLNVFNLRGIATYFKALMR